MYRMIFVSWFTLLSSILIGQHINGITAVATPFTFPTDPYPRIGETNANWICLVPYGFTRQGNPTLRHNVEGQWWGETHEGVIENIKLAKANGLKIFLKPQVYIPGSWPGDLDFGSEEEWEKWEAAYKEYIMSFLDIAIEYDVELFCIGTEFKISETKRSFFWKELIKDMRCKYIGKLTYSSNWDSYQQIDFWIDLDYVGISGYFPLLESDVPNVYKLQRKWKPRISELKAYSKRTSKKILFSEYGYLSVDGCAGKTWELEKKVHQLPINEEAQANAFEGLYSALWDENWWAGGFIWKWFPHGQGHEGYVERDYTPQDKMAEQVIAKWFGKEIE